MGAGTSRKVKCPKCQFFQTNDGTKFLQHIENAHTITCNTCGLKGFSSPDELSKHMQHLHINNKTVAINTDVSDGERGSPCKQTNITCPKCSLSEISDENIFLQHLRNTHQFSSSANMHVNVGVAAMSMSTSDNKNLPKIGDRILAMWSRSKWQYFHATIISYIANKLQYEIEWDDGDTTGRIVDYYNVALDKVPNVKDVGIGSIILFPQAQYKAGGSQLRGGKRWHQGKVTNIYKREDKTYYDGMHTKGASDGKFVTYKGYSEQFTQYELEEFRVGPNVFDILANNDNYASVEDIDIYFSFSESDSKLCQYKSDKDKQHNRLCDPVEIEADLKVKGLNVVDSFKDVSNRELMVKLQKMKSSKVFVACISNQYVLNDQCRMEFQYAKTTLKKPVVPLVLGDGMEWMMSVVGMLIAGELYIHFKDKTVQNDKFKEMLKSLSQHITENPELKIEEDENASTLPPGEVFISYCWTNSYLAKQNNQIEHHNGTEFADPRLISRHLSKEGFFPWLDIERLKSADMTAGLFEQLSKALKEAKVVLPFISDEYAKSINCRMELQFAIKVLGKKVFPVVVGTGIDWKETVVGSLLEANHIEIIDFQNVNDEISFKAKINELINALKTASNSNRNAVMSEQKPKRTSRAPTLGDHVICHHVGFCYYTATVIGYNISTMEYTVNWDDGDPTGRVQLYSQVALDVVPDLDDVGVGSVIFFPQGSYSATAGNNNGGVRYHEGIITQVLKQGNDSLFNGHHTRGDDDGKPCQYRDYNYEFQNISIQHIRIAPTALDTVGNSCMDLLENKDTVLV